MIDYLMVFEKFVFKLEKYCSGNYCFLKDIKIFLYFLVYVKLDFVNYTEID